VGDEPALTAEGVASMAGLSLRRLSGPVVKTILAELAAPNVIAGVLGVRGLPMGRRPAGRTVRQVLELTGKPVVAVPPETVGECPRLFRRILAPLDGTERAAASASGALDALVGVDTEVVVLHVFDGRARPPIDNHPREEFPMWSEEFLDRALPGTRARLECRSGYAANHVVEVSEQEDVDLVIVSWAQVLEGHGDVVRALLSRSKVPVLVMPNRAELPFRVERHSGGDCRCRGAQAPHSRRRNAADRRVRHAVGGSRSKSGAWSADGA
jgi:hypothetical protein